MHSPEHGRDAGEQPRVAPAKAAQSHEPAGHIEDEHHIAEMDREVHDPKPRPPKAVGGVVECQRQIEQRPAVVGAAPFGFLLPAIPPRSPVEFYREAKGQITKGRFCLGSLFSCPGRSWAKEIPGAPRGP